MASVGWDHRSRARFFSHLWVPFHAVVAAWKATFIEWRQFIACHRAKLLFESVKVKVIRNKVSFNPTILYFHMDWPMLWYAVWIKCKLYCAKLTCDCVLWRILTPLFQHSVCNELRRIKSPFPCVMPCLFFTYPSQIPFVLQRRAVSFWVWCVLAQQEHCPGKI